MLYVQMQVLVCVWMQDAGNIVFTDAIVVMSAYALIVCVWMKVLSFVRKQEFLVELLVCLDEGVVSLVQTVCVVASMIVCGAGIVVCVVVS